MIQSVVFSFRGEEIALAPSGNRFTATFSAPDISSWEQPGHVYNGELTAVDDVGNYDSVSVGLRVVETVTPSAWFLEPMEWWFFPTLNATAVFEVHDEESGISSIMLTLDGVEVEFIRQGARCTFNGAVTQGEHELVAIIEDNDGNVVTITRHFAAAGLITNRTLADVEEVRSLSEQANNGNATARNRLNNEQLRGAYNASDLNRVGFATYCVRRVWTALMYPVAGIIAKQDWGAVPTNANFEDYLSDSQAIRNAIPNFALEALGINIPDAPNTMLGFDYKTANDIERILYDSTVCAKFVLVNTFAWASGEISSGES